METRGSCFRMRQRGRIWLQLLAAVKCVAMLPYRLGSVTSSRSSTSAYCLCRRCRAQIPRRPRDVSCSCAWQESPSEMSFRIWWSVSWPCQCLLGEAQVPVQQTFVFCIRNTRGDSVSATSEVEKSISRLDTSPSRDSDCLLNGSVVYIR